MTHRCSHHHFPWAALMALPLLITGCLALPSDAPPPAPTVTSVADTPTPADPMLPTGTPLPSPTVPLICDAAEALRQVDALLAGHTFDAHYLTMNQQLTLSIWLVDPEIDPYATDDSLDENNRRAVQTGLSLFQEVIAQVPCVRKVFVNANPMIVDRLYQGWYRDVVPMRAFPETADLTGGDLLSAMTSSGVGSGFHRRDPPNKGAQPAPDDACTWPEAQAAIEPLFGSAQRNTAAYLIVDAPADTTTHSEGVLVEVQWDAQTVDDFDNAAILKNMNSVAEALACLWPPVDQVEMFVVDTYGQFAVFGMVPGSLIRERVFPLPPDRVLLRPMMEDEW
jgi:hypothetical protein